VKQITIRFFQPRALEANDALFVTPPTLAMDTIKHIINETRAWVQHAVVGLNLCPFAKAPLVKNQIRFVLCEADDPQQLLEMLCQQMHDLVKADAEQLETTLIIHPNVLQNFIDFNDFLDVAEDALHELGYDGILQIASFHPQYQFADAEPDDLSNATNRAPYPTLHLLREASVERAVAAVADTNTIVEANLQTMGNLGHDGWLALQAQCKADAQP
jgi:uncharacterized protein